MDTPTGMLGADVGPAGTGATCCAGCAARERREDRRTSGNRHRVRRILRRRVVVFAAGSAARTADGGIAGGGVAAAVTGRGGGAVWAESGCDRNRDAPARGVARGTSRYPLTARRMISSASASETLVSSSVGDAPATRSPLTMRVSPTRAHSARICAHASRWMPRQRDVAVDDRQADFGRCLGRGRAGRSDEPRQKSAHDASIRLLRPEVLDDVLEDVVERMFRARTRSSPGSC